MTWLFAPFATPGLAIRGDTRLYPIRRIFCVGRNYEAHAAEMGAAVDREAPWYFTKSPASFVASGAVAPYPPGTSNYHHEMELALALGAEVLRADLASAQAAIWGYASALDMTRRDRQQDAKDTRRPWDLGKDVENSAVIAPLSPAADLPDLRSRRIRLTVNGVIKQDASLAEMVWSPAEIVSHLSRFYHLGPGDVILTGTPAGVGPVVAGDVIEGAVDGLEPVRLTLGPAE
jgi:fumarylpyruvate hydrolase